MSEQDRRFEMARATEARMDVIASGRQTMTPQIAGDVRDIIRELRTALAAEKEAREKAEERCGVSVTVGGGLSVYGNMDAIMRVQNYIMLDSTHPVEKEDVRRALMRNLVAAEERVNALSEKLEKAKEALRPFAEEASELASSIGDETYLQYSPSAEFAELGLTDFNVGDLRRARDTLAALGDD